ALIRGGMDPTVFLAFGEEEPLQTTYARELLGPVATREHRGHDGKFFFAQANDPWYLEPERHALVLDRPIYRAQRMLYPMVAGGFGFFPPDVIVWSMLVTNLAALAVGTFLAAGLATRWGLSPWLGLAVPLNIGLIFEIDIGGSGVVAYVLCLAAVSVLSAGKGWAAASLLVAAALAREVMVLFALGLFLLDRVEGRKPRWRLVVTPVVAMAIWNVYLQLRLGDVSGVGGGPEAFSLPFVGMLEAMESWTHDPGRMIVNVAVVTVAVGFIPLALRSRSPIAWGALPFLALMVVLSVHVWREPFDLSRALTPVLTAAPFLVLSVRRRRSTRGYGPLLEEAT
ncbi:MAG: hypothetical protein ACRELC_11490, partial [Gemmatimonadota bacterium]